jgi:hypothetical protein
MPSHCDLTALLAERKEMRKRVASYTKLRRMNDWSRIDAAGVHILQLFAMNQGFDAAELPGSPSLAEVVTAVLVGFSAPEHFDQPNSVFGVVPAVDTDSWSPRIKRRVLELVGPLDPILETYLKKETEHAND